MKPSIEIAVTCTWFQHRLDWMMSSVLEQKGDVPEIIFSVGYPPDNGDPTTEKLCAFFRGKGLNIREISIPMETIQYRGLARNIQMKECTCDWVLWADTDMVYSPYFFDDLGSQLETDLKEETRCISARRVSLDKQHCKDFFNDEDPWKNQYPCVVPNTSVMCANWPVYQISANVGAGYFQLANVKNIRENHGGIYVPEDSNPDWGWLDGKKMQKAKSDRVFRRMVGGVRRIKTKPQYHLNHSRDNEEGYHLTEQR